MAGAEGLSRLDAQRNAACRHGVGRMASVDIEPAGGDRLQPLERLADPVEIGIDPLDRERHRATENLVRDLVERVDIRLVAAGRLEYPFAIVVLVGRGRQGKLIALHHGVDKGIGLVLGQRHRKL